MRRFAGIDLGKAHAEQAKGFTHKRARRNHPLTEQERIATNLKYAHAWRISLVCSNINLVIAKCAKKDWLKTHKPHL